jgi:hypothetical protein
MKKFVVFATCSSVLGAIATPASAHDVHVHYYTAPVPQYAVRYPGYTYSYTNRTVHYVFPSGAVYSDVIVVEPRASRGMRYMRRHAR